MSDTNQRTSKILLMKAADVQAHNSSTI